MGFITQDEGLFTEVSICNRPKPHIQYLHINDKGVWLSATVIETRDSLYCTALIFIQAFSRIEKALRNVRVRNTVIPSEIPISTIRTNGRSFFVSSRSQMYVKTCIGKIYHILFVVKQ